MLLLNLKIFLKCFFKVVIDLGKNEHSFGLTFVALSRVKHIEYFLIEPFPFDRLLKITNSTKMFST